MNLKKIYGAFVAICVFALALPAHAVSVANPIGEGVTPQQFIGRFIAGFLGIVGSLALLMFIYGSYWWLIAMGDPKKVQKGKQILTWSLLGLIAIFGSYAIVNFIFTALGSQ